MGILVRRSGGELIGILAGLGCAGPDGGDGEDPTTPAPVSTGVEECPAGDDEDADGLAGCADPDCAATCDADGDGAMSALLGGDDCDDADPLAFPGAPETC